MRVHATTESLQHVVKIGNNTMPRCYPTPPPSPSCHPLPCDMLRGTHEPRLHQENLKSPIMWLIVGKYLRDTVQIMTFISLGSHQFLFWSSIDALYTTWIVHSLYTCTSTSEWPVTNILFHRRKRFVPSPKVLEHAGTIIRSRHTVNSILRQAIIHRRVKVVHASVCAKLSSLHTSEFEHSQASAKIPAFKFEDEMLKPGWIAVVYGRARRIRPQPIATAGRRPRRAINEFSNPETQIK